jgi:ligand-binding sensor domain-containing protein
MGESIGVSLSRHAGGIGLSLLWLAAGVAALTHERVSPSDPPRALQRMMEPVDRGAAIALTIAPNGDVWWITSDQAVRFEAGEPELRRVAIDLRRRSVDLGGEPDPIAAAHVDAAGTLWIGTRRGAVWSHRDGAWHALEGGFRAQGEPITAIATHEDSVYVAGKGLWRGPREGPLATLPAFSDVPVAHAAAHPEHGVAVVARGRVWRRAASGWHAVWGTRMGDDSVSAIALTSEGELWIGTETGLVRIDRSGRERRDLEGMPIVSLAAGNTGSAYAGTRGSGLFTRYAQGWRPVDAAGERGVGHVTELASAAGGTLWLALGDGGLLRAGPSAPPVAHVSAR